MHQKFTGLGDRLVRAREARGLSQSELGDAIDLSYAAISRIETRGQTKRPTLESIARVLRVRFDWLAHGEGEMELADLRLTLCESHIKTLKALMGKPVIREDVAVPKIAQLRKEILSLKEAAKRL